MAIKLLGVRQRRRDLATVVMAFALALFFLRQSARHPGELGAIDRLVLRLVAPLQGGFATVARALGAGAGRYVDMSRLRAETQALSSENARLKGELLEARRAMQENARLQRLLALRDSTAAATLSARVIALDSSPYFRVARVELDRGAGLVRRGMPVITADGIVGRINSVAGDRSDVQLAVDPRSAIDVILPRTAGRGLLVGKPGSNFYGCQIQYLARGEEPREGDAVVTSGLGGFPRDLPVGTVTKVSRTAAGLFQDVEVTPHVDYARLAEVLVVVAPPPAADPDAGRRRAQASAIGLEPYR